QAKAPEGEEQTSPVPGAGIAAPPRALIADRSHPLPLFYHPGIREPIRSVNGFWQGASGRIPRLPFHKLKRCFHLAQALQKTRGACNIFGPLRGLEIEGIPTQSQAKGPAGIIGSYARPFPAMKRNATRPAPGRSWPFERSSSLEHPEATREMLRHD